MTTTAIADRRVARTRRDIVMAFNDLILARGYERLTVRDVIARANVGRSTFYEHFENKDDLFRQAVRPVLAAFAETIGAAAPAPRLAMMLAHFDENRRVTRQMLRNAAGPLLTGTLADLIEERLAGRTPSAMPLGMVAACAAGGQLAMLEMWIGGGLPNGYAALALAIHASTNAAVDALLPR